MPMYRADIWTGPMHQTHTAKFNHNSYAEAAAWGESYVLEGSILVIRELDDDDEDSDDGC